MKSRNIYGARECGFKYIIHVPKQTQYVNFKIPSNMFSKQTSNIFGRRKNGSNLYTLHQPVWKQI